MTQVWTQRKDYVQLEQLYRKRDHMTADEMDLMDPYILIYAAALRKNGKAAEAMQLATKFKNTVSKDDVYLQSQFLLFQGREDEGLKLLGAVEIGWYNLNLCSVNPIFEKVMDDPRFKIFIKNNSDRLMNQRERILQLENNGYLPRPEDFFQKKSESISDATQS